MLPLKDFLSNDVSKLSRCRRRSTVDFGDDDWHFARVFFEEGGRAIDMLLYGTIGRIGGSIGLVRCCGRAPSVLAELLEYQ